jgi:hypothetical protein
MAAGPADLVLEEVSGWRGVSTAEGRFSSTAAAEETG